jgi:peroxiredoxin
MRSVKIDHFLQAGIVVLAVGLVFVLYSAIHQNVVVAGDTAPKFSLTADDGRRVSVPDFDGKLLILNFWASWCQPCVEEAPSLSTFARQFADKGVVVLAVSVDKDPGAYRKFLERFRPAFHTARDLTIHEDYGTFVYPESYFIAPNGKVLRKLDVAGVIWTDPEMVNFVNSVL